MSERMTNRDEAGNVGTVGEFVSTYRMMQQLCTLEEDVEHGRLVRVTRCKDCVLRGRGTGEQAGHLICSKTGLHVCAYNYCGEGYTKEM